MIIYNNHIENTPMVWDKKEIEVKDADFFSRTVLYEQYNAFLDKNVQYRETEMTFLWWAVLFLLFSWFIVIVAYFLVRFWEMIL